MPEQGVGNAAQIRLIVEQVVDAAMVRLSTPEPEPKPVEVPAPLKWAGGILAAILSISASGGFIWMVSTVNEMQVTLARMDERQQSQAGDSTGRFEEVNRRITRLEAYHASEGPRNEP